MYDILIVPKFIWFYYWPAYT